MTGRVVYAIGTARATILKHVPSHGPDVVSGLLWIRSLLCCILNLVDWRIGQGYDVHPLREGRRLVLGGVEIAHERGLGLAGHSDADALLHAIADAVLGAAGLGDIGTYFPPSDERWRDASSLDLLGRAVALAREDGWRVVNVDATVVAERPRIAPHVPLMRERIAARLGVSAREVGVKATTNEGLGALGREEGIAALAIALLKKD